MNRTSFATGRLIVSTCIITFAIAVSFSSCRKEEEPIIQPVPLPQPVPYHLPITTGSYWIYQQERTDAAGNITQTGSVDSVYVEGDTIINSITYKKIRTVVGSGSSWFPPAPLIIMRDSAGYLVNSDGSFIEHDNFTDTLDYINFSGMAEGWYFMRHQDSSVTVPAGTFTTIDYISDIYSFDPNYPHPNPRHTHQLFADNVGKVAEVLYYYSLPDYIQRRLLRYHIQ